MLTALRTDWRARFRLMAARWLVDVDFYLERYPDIRAAGIDPVQHFAEYGLAVPIRAANAVMERAIIRGAPLLGLATVLLRTERNDWVQCFVERYQYLACSNLGVEYHFARWVARLLATESSARSSQNQIDRDRILGRVLSIARIETCAYPWLTLREIDPPVRQRFSGPRLWGQSKPPSIHEVTLPALWCATIHQASVFGSMQVATHDCFLRYEPAADPNLSYSAGQYRHIIACFPPRQNKVLARLPDQATYQVESAILLGGRCGNNHFHFLIEYLTKGYIIERAGLPEGLPMIIPDDLFPAQLEAIQLLFQGRDLIKLSATQRLDVDRLHIPSLMTYFPDALEVQDCKKEGLRQESLRWLRDRTFAAMPPKAKTIDPVPRVYLSRRRGRNIVNAAEVEAAFIDHGFTSIDPSGLSFIEQVSLFSNATHVAGPVGAAFANTVFCKPGTTIIHLGSRHARTSSLFQNLAAFAGCSCIRLMSDGGVGDVIRVRRNTQSLRQGSYKINLKSLRTLLDACVPRQ